MKKFLFTTIILLLAIAGYSQLNNSWIDYSKTYYRFKVYKDTLCRISQPTLAVIGLAGTPAQNFQLWRNGKEVRVFTSVAGGTLGATDYIEFWGEMNDGKPDKNLYRNPDYQLDDKYSLFSDTATYYLTVNAAGGNLRYVQSANPVVGNVLPADAYFMRRIEVHYRSQINRGYSVPLGQSVYSSAFDIGEGWSSGDISGGATLSNDLANMNKYAAGPANSVIFTVTACGNSFLYTRDLAAVFYNTQVLPQPNPMPYMSYHRDTVRNLPLSLLQSNTNLPVGIRGMNSSNPANDRIIVPTFSVTYPATFNFNNQKNFYFELAASATGNFLIINNFNSNGIEPVLYDITNSRRYLGDINTPGQVKFVLPASTDPVRKFNLLSQHAASIYNVDQLTAKIFINFNDPANQGDYVIISNPVLYNNGNGINYVDQYRQYRSSVAGGSYNARVYDINELTEQFGFGINKHPGSIRDFVSFAGQQFAIKPKFVFLIGRGLTYIDHKANESNPDVDKLDLVPTFGWPPSDILLVSNPGTIVPITPVGRLGAVSGNEVSIYLEKMKQYEVAQKSTSQTITDKAWMKNFLHTSGGSDSSENIEFLGYLNNYKNVAEDTLMGAHVETYAKSTVAAVEQTQSTQISKLFQDGLAYIGYFGHAGATALAINLNYPENYINAGKYPFMQLSGCTVGNYYNFDPQRLLGYDNMSLSEKYIFLNQKGAIGFLASTHFGIAPFLNYYNNVLYKDFCNDMYGSTVGEQIKNVIQQIGSNPQSLDYYTRIHLEETNLHGDPALKIHNFTKPDYVIEDQLVKLSPNIISVADGSFKIDIKMMNIGKAINDSIRVTVKQKLPNDTIKILYNQMIRAIRNIDSLNLSVNINPITDKGLNKLIVSLDDGNRISESSETNNILNRDFYIFEDEIRPITPYNYSIVNQQNISFYASTANPLSGIRQYVMEIDTTELFNSSFKKVYNANGPGGIIQFNPTNVTFTDSTVYYWRTATVPSGTSSYIWNTFSFVYLTNSTTGFNQSHYYQFLKSSYTDIHMQDNRKFEFDKFQDELFISTGNFPPNDYPHTYTSLTSIGTFGNWGNAFNTLQFLVLNGRTGEPKTNIPQGSQGAYGSNFPAGGRTRQFEFRFNTPAQRKVVMDFIDSMPANATIILYPLLNTGSIVPFANDWKADENIFGPGNSLYHKLYNNGFTRLDSFNSNKPFLFIFNKVNYFPAIQKVGTIFSEILTASLTFDLFKQPAYITSPYFGPANKWTQFHFRGKSEELPQTDRFYYEIFGSQSTSGTETKLVTVYSARDTTIDFIDAKNYPYLKVKMFSMDSVQATPFQLSSLVLNGNFVPEGVVAPNILFVMKDTVEQGQKIDFKLAFKNISLTAFDSLMKINFIITDRNNLPHTISIPKGKKLLSGDTLIINYQIDTKDYPGANILFVEVNPNNDQAEQFHFNNILYKDFYVNPDNYNPLLDVTFDGVHILNKDIVAAKPHIYISLKDESKFLALNDTSLFKVQVLFPDKTLHNYRFGDSMRFNPANTGGGENTASIDFEPYFRDDGDYELIVSGKDVAGNKAGAIEYRVIFNVLNKPMISNLLNYPNPFTTSTAFVFTVTGSEVPQNIRIQILTISGKVVREITKDELGPIHIGRNITEFKWDGTDMYGQKLGNGVYLYRVLTNLNGKSLEQFKEKGDKTDKYFNKGYGKMVIIR